jgi:CHASE3 domain sensor protein
VPSENRLLYAVALSLVLGFAIAVAGSVWMFRESALANKRSESLADLRIAAANVLKLQVDEETGIRGYIENHNAGFLEPYRKAEADMGPATETLERGMLMDDALSADFKLLQRGEQLHHVWLTEVAEPSLRRGMNRDPSVPIAGKAIVDEYRLLFARMDVDIAAAAAAERKTADRTFFRGVVLGASAVGIAGLLAVVALVLLRTASEELGRERAITGVLQAAFTGSSEAAANISFGSAYVSATKGAAVGGDLFDLHAIDANRSLVLVADVSGKGIHAAVDTALVKYAARTLIRSNDNPAYIAGALNELYRHERSDPGSFVVLFLGLLDVVAPRFEFVNAGLATAYVVHGANPYALNPTGPALGIIPQAQYGTQRIDFRRGDRLVVATDGLVEARSRSGEFVGEERFASWVRSESGAHADAQTLVDGLIARLRRFTDNRMGDDLALISLLATGGQSNDLN